MTGDPGLFTPQSVTWQMHGDPMMWVAGVRALYLQALHPRAVRGVMQNSDFRRDAWGRLMRTANFVGTTTYGTTEAAEKAGARVRKIHTLLQATDPDTGERYRIDEPELLLWVHCAEIDSYLHVARRSGYPLTDAAADRYLAEHRFSARLVGLDPDAVPADRAAMAAYFEKTRPELAAGALKEGSAGTVLHGELERGYRSAVIFTFGGGNNEIQREIISWIGLGMPRVRR